jgi:hypothetical protein
MNRSSAEVEAEVEASRSNLDRNVEALKQKMTPGQLFDEAARLTGSTGQQVAAKFAEQAKANPMPLAVMGLGLAWLMFSNSKSQSEGAYSPSDYRYEPRSFAGDESGGGLKAKAHEIGEKAQDMMAGVKDKVAGARASAADSGHAAMDGMSATAGQVRERAGQAAQAAQRTFAQTLESEPLLLAGLGLIVGAAVGAALPATAAENRVLGEHRDKLLEKGKDLAQTGMEKASDVAQATYGAVKSELQSGDDGREPAERFADAARTGVQAAQEQLQGGQTPGVQPH